jgi:hypothetical protein
MAAFTGDQPIGTNATATTFILQSTASIVNWQNLSTQSSAPYTHIQLYFTGDPAYSIKPLTSINAQAYTTYPKIP